jgi:type IV pilus assembly protein PilF
MDQMVRKLHKKKLISFLPIVRFVHGDSVAKIFSIIFLSLLLSACATQSSVENATAAGYNVQLGLGYLAQNDPVRAKEKLLRARAQAPDSVDAHLALAYYFQTIEHPEAAQLSYAQALKLSPEGGKANNNYAAFLCAQGDYAKALDHFERAVADLYYPQTAAAYENAALCAAQIPQWSLAQEYAQMAMQQDPMRSRIWLKLSTLMAQQGDDVRAKEYLERYNQLRV